MADEGMKRRVARTMKWNVVDKVASQLLYALTGVILARLLSQEDFGLVGAVLVFQAFATLFVDSGFSSALIQRKRPDRLDYSTVLWFNLGIAVGIYIILWFCAPLIARCFQDDQRLIPLSRVMFLSFIINAAAIVQTNRLMKRMDVRMVAVSNSIGLVISGGVGVWLAVTGWGAWAIVWQTITLATVKTLILWFTGHWLPLLKFSWTRLRSFFKVGVGVMGASFLNVLFQNIYSFFIGNRVGLVSLGYYTQADKWSKMGVSSLAAVLTQSFLPALSEYQDDPEKYAAATAKMNRTTAYLLFPFTGLLIVMATSIFHALFGTKWDAAIALFCILLIRGVFNVITQVYSYYLLSLARSKWMVWTEVVRDGAAIVAIVATLPVMGMSTEADPCLGLRYFLWGQVIASLLSWVFTLVVTARYTWRSCLQYLADLLPYIVITAVAVAPCWWLGTVIANPWLAILVESVVGLGIYMGVNGLLRSKVQADALAYLRGRL